ncbi:MAG: ABC transporter substrate-binding protein [Alphaproteobacteria bacterium]|uniref:ABC transporter substrate-binding protein n=2 Tax=Rhizobiaceae TaxID=82115 RepID=UPI0006B8FBE5|nr:MULTISPECIES: ABC transporter substrate-binding protein [Rhizobium/Agrobacterium group]MBU0737319.1 ABC transporter substrate-binding protein [Alphaproteobacteria bacterium]AOG08230.1 bacterial extracellular solute-binding family protein [Agrobacterium sp. RAC06]KPF51651.1 iron ABC transporter substrate-binding protein [Rhizobium sp. AAP116]MBU0833333.1 ABC transporter substrate-binding protein [Alphaproteobacteria bacterium]MBU1765908.1 ABC transporter substrate-binding protein [Alphaprote
MTTNLRKFLSLTTALVMTSSAVAYAEPSAELIEAAKKEGMLTTIALPHDWCGYGEVIAAFKAKYPEITVNELNPDAGSADEVEAIKANKDNKGPQAPDVVDVGLAFGPQMKAEGLLQPYKVSTWDEIPDNIKDAEGYWYGDYYGVMSLLVNKDLVANTPKDWADLLKPEYAGQVALAGDPRASNQAILGVLAAGMATGAAAGKDAGEAGLNYFAEMNKAGNFVPVIGKSGTLAQGATPIVVMWDYNALAARDTLAGNPPVEVVVPDKGVLAGVYVQGISAYAPHPNAAKLWMEHLYSDEGQLGWLKGYCHPARFNAMVKAGKVPQDLLDALPPAESYEKAYFPTLEEVDANKAAVTAGWDSVVGANVQ